MKRLPPAQPPQQTDFVDIPNNRTLLRYYQKLYQHFSYANNFGLALDDDDRAGKRGKSILLSKLFVAPKLSPPPISARNSWLRPSMIARRPCRSGSISPTS
ncbi:MAG: hypothetical protein GY820_14410 [Gammaproteobacteria bacterium]|nr:hypothetical protein [Gammaproteobacteria bacterium]